MERKIDKEQRKVSQNVGILKPSICMHDLGVQGIQNIVYIQRQRMNSRSERKTPKKNSGKQSSKMKSTMLLRTLVDFNKEPLYMYVQFFLRKKYIDKQLRSHEGQKIRKLIFNTNKLTTQLRLMSSEKQNLCKVYSNSLAIIKLRSTSEYKYHQKSLLFPKINTDNRIQEIIQQHRKSKLNLAAKNSKCLENQRYQKSKTPILSTVAFDDSEHCLKTLVSKIDNMIKQDYQLTSSRNILEGLSQSQNNFHEEIDSFFGNASKKISEINMTKEFSRSTKTGRKSDRDIEGEKSIQKMQSTQPLVYVVKTTTDEYGIMRHVKPSTTTKRKRNIQTTYSKERIKNSNLSNDSSKKSKSLSNCSNKKDEKEKDKEKKKKAKRQSPYQQPVKQNTLSGKNNGLKKKTNGIQSAKKI